MKKLCILSLTLGSIFFSIDAAYSQNNVNTQEVEIVLGNQLDINSPKLTPGRIPIIFPNLSAQDKESFTLYGEIVEVGNNGKWLRVRTNESMDNVLVYINTDNAIFEENMLGKFITTQGKLQESTFTENQIQSKSTNANSLNNMTNPLSSHSSGFELKAEEIIISTPY